MDIIVGMTDDRTAYQLAQRSTKPCVSLWITRLCRTWPFD
jgi:hypothetical protein